MITVAKIASLTRDFRGKWNAFPEVVCFTKADFHSMQNLTSFAGPNGLFMGMDIDIGPKTEVRFKSRIVLDDFKPNKSNI